MRELEETSIRYLSERNALEETLKGVKEEKKKVEEELRELRQKRGGWLAFTSGTVLGGSAVAALTLCQDSRDLMTLAQIRGMGK